MVFIYILELDENKYYVGKTNNPEFRIDSHFDSSGSAWTKKYKPVKVVQLIPDCDDYDEDKYTRVYMDRFGVDNVRGGSFCKIKLSKNEKSMLNNMKIATNDLCFTCKEEGHFSSDCPKNNITIYKTKAIDNRIKLYLDHIDKKRFNDENDLKIIYGSIYNETETDRLMDEYFYKYSTVDKNRYYKIKEKKIKRELNIRHLINMAENDLGYDLDSRQKLIVRDKTRIVEHLFFNGISDLYLAYLYYSSYGSNFVYYSNEKMWYSRNKYGIFIKDKTGSTLHKTFGFIMTTMLKDEYALMCKEYDRKNNNIPQIMGRNYNKIRKHCEMERGINSVISSFKKLSSNNKIYDLMDNNPTLIGFNNGVYDLVNHEFRKALGTEYVSLTTGYEYRKAKPILKEEAMNIFRSIFPDEGELRFMLKHLSLGLLGRNPNEMFYIWIGNGANGKGVLRDIMSTVLGDYYDSMDIAYLQNTNKKDANGVNPVMARKQHSRFVISTEPQSNVKLDSNLIKAISGNDPQQVRTLYGESFNFTPAFSLVIQTNTEPEFDSFDQGLQRRITMIRFPNKFVSNPRKPNERLIDTSIKEKILNKKLYVNEFLEILLDHYKLYCDEGLELPERFMQETNRLIREYDSFNEWFRHNLIITNNKKDKIISSDINADYESFMDGDRRGIGPTQLKSLLLEKGVTSSRQNKGIFYFGVKFVDEEEYASDDTN